MVMNANRRFALAARPEGMPKVSDFELETVSAPEPADGEVLVHNLLFSLEPYQRNLMGNSSSEWPPLAIGDTMGGPTVGIVEESRDPAFQAGDHVQTWSGWQELAVVNGTDLRKIDSTDAPLSTALGPLGLTGFSAWYGMTKLHHFKPGGTLLVSGASGSVGSVAAQLGRLRGMRVVGLAGGREKASFLTEGLGLAASIDYKAHDLAAQLECALPDGIDAYFENVGASSFASVMGKFNTDAKIILCGTISEYNGEPPSSYNHDLSKLLSLFLYRFIDIRSFQTTSVLQAFPDFLGEMTPLVKAGRIIYREEFLDGFEKLPEALVAFFDGKGSGAKVMVRR